MSISKGNTGIGKAYVGPKEVEKAFVGDKLIYQSGIPVDPVFANNDWATIRAVVRSGNIPATWAVGDMKDIRISLPALPYYQDIFYRICDKQAGRYALADGSGSSNMVLEPVDLLLQVSERVNSSGGNSGGYAISDLRQVLNSTIYNMFPQDVKDAMSEVLVLSGTGGGSTSGTSSSANKLFLPAEMEMFSAKQYSVGLDECPLGQFDYYKTHDTDADRIKKQDGAARPYWLRSPYTGNNARWCLIMGVGRESAESCSYLQSIAPFFAI